ncbi:MAG: SPOR domain-containing protein [Hyphomicrobiales bacterium]
MDQNSSNGSGADKRSWRERLGIGGKDMPKISGEFKAAAPPPALKVPQPVAKPAPMAPRATTPKSPPAPNAEALADKLRNQRAAAEKLAEQRVSAARERAEAKFVPPPAPAAEPSYLARPEPRAEQGKPKFMFADEEPSPAKAESAPPRELPPPPKPRSAAAPPPLVPPRPALGGDRLPSLARPPVPPGQPQYRPQAPSSYRPIDPAAAPPQPFRAGGSTARSYLPAGTVPPDYADPRHGSARPGQETHWRGPETGAGYGDGGLEGDPRLARGMPPRARHGVAADDYGDVFEDEPSRPRRRASASEYDTAYREVEDGYEDDRRRTSGPWLLLLALLIAAVATFGVIWYYQTHIKNTAATATPDTVPVVAAPEQPAKTAAEQPVDNAATVGTANKKQIYDRIVGDQEVSGEKIAPAEAPPIAPESLQPAASEASQPPAGTSPDSESEPLALPPPPGEGGTGDGNTQGSISQTPEQQTIARKLTDTDAVVAQPEPASDTAADALLPPAPAETVATVPEPAPIAPAEPVVKKTETKSTAAKKQTGEQVARGAEPVVLVPPAEYVPPASATGSPQNTAAANTQTETKKKKTLFDLFQGAGKSDSATQSAAAQSGTSAADASAPEPAQQVATLPEPAPPQQQSSSSAAAGGGYVVQLASFRSEAEAQTEYGRLKAKHPGIIGGLPPRISQATVSGSTRYRLGLGPLAAREQAVKLCSSLVAAGERDCLVRKQ